MLSKKINPNKNSQETFLCFFVNHLFFSKSIYDAQSIYVIIIKNMFIVSTNIGVG